MSNGMSATVEGLGKDTQVIHTCLLLSILQEQKKPIAVIKCRLGLSYSSRTYITQRKQWEAGNTLSSLKLLRDHLLPCKDKADGRRALPQK